ncbi:hypothetical protein [Falsibacillus albus]|uniref:Uncharacterized protein n=1 Tax=Falsibacillus albus TaxID=2478915 RepID=A0A3L7K0Z5_9BACI|nr:hypothetical protein [Falsibacillus albus]RLQ94322.1 hypothetical protein D9X91_14800 [Falsibacillus albus]
MFRLGDYIRVYSAGNTIGTGIFLKFATEEELLAPTSALVWLDESDLSMHVTDLATINIQKLNYSNK